MLDSFVSLVFAALSFLPAGPPAPSYLLGDYSYSDNTQPYNKWNAMAARYLAQQNTQGQCAGCKAAQWKAFVDSLKNKPFEEQLQAVNDYANAFPYMTDKENWGVENYWETPYQFLEVSGNCKDYAIFKYFSLRMLGIPASRLRLIVLDDLMSGGITHAVLGVYNEKGELFVLDNLISGVVPARAISFYRPIYAINENASWLYRGEKMGARKVVPLGGM